MQHVKNRLYACLGTMNDHLTFLYGGIDWALSAGDSSLRDTSSADILHPKDSWNSQRIEMHMF